MALNTELVYTKAWDASDNEGAEVFPASVQTEGAARENLQFQHDQAKHKINEIVQAIATTINSSTDTHERIPTVKAVTNIVVQSDWNQSDNTQRDFIKNKPTLSTVATSGAYSDLSGKPTLATVATSGDYDDLTDKPSIPTVSGTSGKIAQFTGANAVGDAFTLTISSSSPTGGSDGDIWIKYEA